MKTDGRKDTPCVTASDGAKKERFYKMEKCIECTDRQTRASTYDLGLLKQARHFMVIPDYFIGKCCEDLNSPG